MAAVAFKPTEKEFHAPWISNVRPLSKAMSTALLPGQTIQACLEAGLTNGRLITSIPVFLGQGIPLSARWVASMSFGISARMRRTTGLFKAGMRSVASADARGPYPKTSDSFLGLSLRRWLPTLRWPLQIQRPGFATNLAFEIDGAPRSVA